MTTLSTTVTSLILLPLTLATTFNNYFPCGAVPPCADDPTFLFLGSIPCGQTQGTVDPCDSPQGSAACGLSCLSCPICTDPEIPEGHSAVVQYSEVATGVLSIYANSSETIAGYQGQLACKAGGKTKAVRCLE